MPIAVTQPIGGAYVGRLEAWFGSRIVLAVGTLLSAAAFATMAWRMTTLAVRGGRCALRRGTDLLAGARGAYTAFAATLLVPAAARVRAAPPNRPAPD